MIRGTTPTLTFTIKNQDIDLSAAQNVYVTLAQGSKLGSKLMIEKTGADLEIETRTVSVFLTQKESLQLLEGSNCEVQINWTYLDIDGETVRRAATKVKSIPISKQLLRREIQ